MLLQDAHADGGLQARLGGRWVDTYIAGATSERWRPPCLLELVSHGRFGSSEHRVLANQNQIPARVSVACLGNTDIARFKRLYGPFTELTSGPGGDRARASVTVTEFQSQYNKKGLDGRPALDHFRLD